MFSKIVSELLPNSIQWWDECTLNGSFPVHSVGVCERQSAVQKTWVWQFEKHFGSTPHDSLTKKNHWGAQFYLFQKSNSSWHGWRNPLIKFIHLEWVQQPCNGGQMIEDGNAQSSQARKLLSTYQEEKQIGTGGSVRSASFMPFDKAQR